MLGHNRVNVYSDDTHFINVYETQLCLHPIHIAVERCANSQLASSGSAGRRQVTSRGDRVLLSTEK